MAPFLEGQADALAAGVLNGIGAQAGGGAADDAEVEAHRFGVTVGIGCGKDTVRGVEMVGGSVGAGGPRGETAQGCHLAIHGKGPTARTVRIRRRTCQFRRSRRLRLGRISFLAT